MSQENVLVEDEGLQSPDMFSDADMSASGNNMTDDSTSSASGNMAEPVDTYPDWKGISLDEIHKGFSPFDFEHLPPIVPSHNHTVLFAMPLPGRGVPKPYPSQPVDKWNQDYVRMPHSPHSRYPNNKEDGTDGFRQRWEVIQEALLQAFYSSRQLELAILSYNHKYSQRWNFCALHHFFSKVVDEDEAEVFFETLLPKIIGLALQLPELLTGGIPLLKRHMNASISLSQMQVASLLANAFLCTFPRRNSSNPQSEYANYPHINFNRLFSSMTEKRSNRTQSVMEKLKCIFHYFRRVTSKAPEGTITIQRKYIAKENFPKWATRDERLPLLHITSKGTIESEGTGLLQVDFANKYVGGGVMNFGCVQEEIRFVICPELFVTMLVTEALDDTEALVVSGVEQYSRYEGYSDNFYWAGDFVDETPRDNSGRRKTCIVAIDALHFRQPDMQFNMDKVNRELNKAYVGFCMKEMPVEHLCAVATGNWGCGAFRGNPKLKVLVQLIAAAVAKRSVVYFTFGNTELRDSVADMYWYLVGQNVTIGQLYQMLCDYRDSTKSSKQHSDFYLFLYNKAKMKNFYTSRQPKLSFQPQRTVPKTIPKPSSPTTKTDSKPKNPIPKTPPKSKSPVFKKHVNFEKLSVEERKDAIRKLLEESDEESDEDIDSTHQLLSLIFTKPNAKVETKKKIEKETGQRKREEKENECCNGEKKIKNGANSEIMQEKLQEKSDEKLEGKLDEKLPEKSNEKLEEKSDEKLPEKLNEKLPEKSIEKLPEKSDETLEEKSNEKLQEKSDEKCNEKVVDDKDAKEEYNGLVKEVTEKKIENVLEVEIVEPEKSEANMNGISNVNVIDKKQRKISDFFLPMR